MDIDEIVFNPYEENNLDDAINAIERYFVESHPEHVLEKLANRIYLDNSVEWKKILHILFRKYSLMNIIPNHYHRLVNENRYDIIPQYTYLIVSLISSKLLRDDIFNEDLLKKLTDNEGKYILFSFLSSWNLEKALELDNNFTLNNFGHLIDVKNVPIKSLILSSRDEALYNVVQKVLEDSIAQYHFNQEIQRIIKNNHPEELDTLEYFINKCSCDKQENVLEFICDLFELTSIQHFLNSRWKIDLTERIYKNFSRNQNLMSPIAKRNALTAVNRFKSRLAPNFSLVARHEISRLSENDKNFIIKKVGKISEEIIGEFINTLVPVEKKWDWKEYAYFLVKWYKDLNPLEDAINVVKLGKDLGIKIIVKEFETENFDACLVRDKTLKSPIVFINSFKKSRGRINFSIAHELAHAILPHHAQSTFFCFLEDVTESNKFVMNRKLENEANAFASYVLLPDKIFKEEISKLNYTIKNVNTLSKKYNSSLVLVAKKWVEQSNLEIAMIFSTNGVIDWATTSENFPFSWVDYIASTSTVFKVIESQERKIKKQRVSSTNWFNKDYPIYKIHEESYKIFDDKVLTLLQIIEDN